MSTEGREGPTPANPSWPLWNVDCLEACGMVTTESAPERPTRCGACGSENVMATRLMQIAEPIGYRRRGAPALPPELKKREKLVVALTEEAAQRYRIIAAQRGYKNVNDWARDALESEANRKEPHAMQAKDPGGHRGGGHGDMNGQ